MDRLLLACALATVAGLIGLGALGQARDLRPERFEDLPRLDGQRVCVDAVVAHLRPVDAGAHLVLVQGDRSLSAFARFAPHAVTGDEVRACGHLDGSSGTLRLLIDRPGDVRLLRPFDAQATPLVLLARQPWDYLDLHVAVYGHLSPQAGRLWLRDATTQAQIALAATDDLPPVDVVRILGVVEFEAERSSFRLRVEEATPA